MKFAIIGGTNIETLPIPYREQAISTPYGDAVVCFGKLEDGNEVLFLPRHGVLNDVDSCRINYRANIYALHQLGVTHAIGITRAGTCDYSYKLGSVCLMTDFIDFTRSRKSTFYREHRIARHVSMEDVFSPTMNDALEHIIIESDLPYAGRTVYACTEGPRFETAAEVRMLRMLGAQVVGMVMVPEAPLCRQVGIEYAGIGIVSNYCTGMSGELRDESIREVVLAHRADVFNLCFDYIRRMSKEGK